MRPCDVIVLLPVFDDDLGLLKRVEYFAVQQFVMEFLTCDLAPNFYSVLSSLQRFWVVVFAVVAACCGAVVRSHSGCAAPHHVTG